MIDRGDFARLKPQGRTRASLRSLPRRHPPSPAKDESKPELPASGARAAIECSAQDWPSVAGVLCRAAQRASVAHERTRRSRIVSCARASCWPTGAGPALGHVGIGGLSSFTASQQQCRNQQCGTQHTRNSTSKSPHRHGAFAHRPWCFLQPVGVRLQAREKGCLVSARHRMNTKTTWRVLGSLVLSIGSSGCHGEPHGLMQPPAQDACANYGGLTALLAEATIRCTGTIGPQSFTINGQGLLQNTFSACTSAPEKENLEKVTKLLGLQSFRSALPKFQECLTDRYTRWSELFQRTNLKSCPVWTEPTVIGEGDRASNTQLSKMQPRLPYVPASDKDPHVKPTPEDRFVDIQAPSKSSILYKISYPQPEPSCDDPAVCAAQCAAFLPGFVVSAAGNHCWRIRHLGSEIAPCCLARPPGTDDPWCPPYVHAMAITRTSAGSTVPPGDLYGHPNRGNMGERCVRWLPPTETTPGTTYITDLGLECVAPGDCLSRCGD